MLVYFGADHRGFDFKSRLKRFVQELGYEIYDVGNKIFEDGDDYPDFAAKVALEVSRNPEEVRGILICGSGAGMDIVANKFPGVRSVLALNSDQIYDARRDDDINVVTLASSFHSIEETEAIVRMFLETKFSGADRHMKRLEKIKNIEEQNFGSTS